MKKRLYPAVKIGLLRRWRRKPTGSPISTAGFTLIELLVTIAIFAVVATAGFISLSRYKGGQDVELSMSEVVAAVRDVQKRSVTEQDGNQWGVRFDNASSSYEIWSGTSYASGTVDKLYSLRRNVVFGNPSTSTLDTIFSAISGKVSENRVISLFNTRKDGLVGDITVLSRGTITNRLDNGLVGYWHFDEATSTAVYDASGNSNDGSITGATWQTSSSCKAGECLSFDGTDDEVIVSDDDSLDITSAITLLTWINTNDLADNTKYILRKEGQGYGLIINISETPGLEIRINDAWSTIVSNTALTIGEWSMVAGTYDGSVERLYVNGVETASTTVSGTINTTASQLSIGDGGSTTQFFDGSLDEVRVYNRALTATEISNLYNDLK